ncbi:type II secretion system minor pseudopilin GspK [Glaciecola sp. 2405UD65-10]|jgi:general secretion pathway protein K|uniref:type II secretion system minor pseudopilin GspK n=1 Tax=Glaciecola sp. 2405UD65-10 TaxID=3397244 RepID=UPI003B597924
MNWTVPSTLFQHTKARQKGVALIVVMLIVALISVLAVEMSGRLQVNIARTSNVKANNQAFWYAMGAEQYAMSALQTLQSTSDDNINLSQPWTQDFAFPVEGGSIEAKLTDLQACLNVNAINSEPIVNSSASSASSLSQQAFLRFIENYIEDSYEAETIRDSLIDWVDEDDIPSSLGAEDSDYESLPMPYLAANTTMSSLSEVRLVNGIEAIFQSQESNKILEALCVLPELNIKVNVNTITQDNAVVLSALLGQTLDVGQDIISSRPEDGFAEIEDFLKVPEVEASQLTADQLVWFEVTTEYFKLNTRAKFNGTQFRMSTIFKLEDETVSVISREFGGAF